MTGKNRVRAPARSGSPVRLAIRAKNAVERPVDLARLFVARGISLRRAHETLTKLAAGQPAFIELHARTNRELIAELQAFGLVAQVLKRRDIDVREVRNRLGLSQAEFAVRFGFEVDTIQNWEQGRNKPDGAALLLLRIIDTNPDVVDHALAVDSA